MPLPHVILSSMLGVTTCHFNRMCPLTAPSLSNLIFNKRLLGFVLEHWETWVIKDRLINRLSAGSELKILRKIARQPFYFRACLSVLKDVCTGPKIQNGFFIWEDCRFLHVSDHYMFSNLFRIRLTLYLPCSPPPPPLFLVHRWSCGWSDLWIKSSAS